MIKLKKKLNDVWFNISAIFIGLLIALLVAVNTINNLPQSSNHGGFIPLINIVMGTAITLIAYLSLKRLLKNHSWIITFIGIVLTIFSAKYI